MNTSVLFIINFQNKYLKNKICIVPDFNYFGDIMSHINTITGCLSRLQNKQNKKN